MKEQEFPKFIAQFLWSFDLAKLDLENDKKRIITNILNLGTKQATDWLFSFYDRQSIVEVLKNPMPGEWSAKSLNYWGLILEIETHQPAKRILSAV